MVPCGPSPSGPTPMELQSPSCVIKMKGDAGLECMHAHVQRSEQSKARMAVAML